MEKRGMEEVPENSKESLCSACESRFSRELNCSPKVMQMSFTSTLWLKVGIVVGILMVRTFCITSGARI
jgi:hypothetical protein